MSNERPDCGETVSYIEDMLAELGIMAQKVNKPMLAYLIEMAMVEAADIVATGAQPCSAPTHASSVETGRFLSNGSLK